MDEGGPFAGGAGVSPEADGLVEPARRTDAVPHESASKHVTGRAEYVDDIPEPADTLHAYIGVSACAHADIAALDLGQAAAMPGVIGTITARDVPGPNDISPQHKGDDPLFAAGRVSYHGQPLFAVIARTRDEARRAAQTAQVLYTPLVASIDVADALADGGVTVGPGMTIARGDAGQALAAADAVVSGSITVGGQEHFYLEGQVALAMPGEDGEMLIHSATQHPSDVQEVVARILGLEANGVRVYVRRMGGGFGGKESQATVFAAVAAVAARKFGRAVKVRPDRDDDMMITGKRHDFVVDYQVGHDREGRILAVDAVYNARCGHSEDLSRGVTDRTLMHADNAYFYPHVKVSSRLLRTNTVSNTAFRGYGGPQAVVAAERLIEDIAYAVGKDPLAVRKLNFYRGPDRNTTHYGQELPDNILDRIVDELEASSDYQRRRAEIIRCNARSAIVKHGIALVPVKFGISFSKKTMNQAGVLLNVYRDGSVHLNHGGTEMGQGLHTKMLQLAAEEFGVELSRVRITPTATDKVPNASPTAGSLGTDLNGMAVVDAARQIKTRLTGYAAAALHADPETARFAGGALLIGGHRMEWNELVSAAYAARVSLSATGFYATPRIHWDRQAGRGEPYLYFTYGASCSEVAVDTLTGEYTVLRTDILQDVGHSLNPAVDLGQIEGGFVQGMGWLTSEELWWDRQGRLRTHAPSTYKIPLASDVPPVFNVAMAKWSVNAAETVRRSKAVGEPPIMLATSVFSALGMAVASVAGYRIAPRLNVPATPEHILLSIERLRRLDCEGAGAPAAEAVGEMA